MFSQACLAFQWFSMLFRCSPNGADLPNVFQCFPMLSYRSSLGSSKPGNVFRRFCFSKFCFVFFLRFSQAGQVFPFVFVFRCVCFLLNDFLGSPKPGKCSQCFSMIFLHVRAAVSWPSQRCPMFVAARRAHILLYSTPAGMTAQNIAPPRPHDHVHFLLRDAFCSHSGWSAGRESARATREAANIGQGCEGQTSAARAR